MSSSGEETKWGRQLRNSVEEERVFLLLENSPTWVGTFTVQLFATKLSIGKCSPSCITPPLGNTQLVFCPMYLLHKNCAMKKSMAALFQRRMGHTFGHFSVHVSHPGTPGKDLAWSMFIHYWRPELHFLPLFLLGQSSFSVDASWDAVSRRVIDCQVQEWCSQCNCGSPQSHGVGDRHAFSKRTL